MKKRSESFFKMGETVSSEYRGRVLEKAEVTLTEVCKTGVSVGDVERVRDRRHRLYLWGGGAFGFAASVVMIVVALGPQLFNSERSAPAIAKVEQLPATPSALVPTVAPPVTAVAVSKPVKPRMRRLTKLPERVDIELVANLDMILVLHVLKEMDVLTRWQGACLKRGPASAWSRVLAGGSLVFAIQSADAAEIQLDKSFLSSMRKTLPNMSYEQQRELMRSIKHLRKVWPEQAETIQSNYQVWKKTGKSERKALRDRYKTWKRLPAQSQAKLLKKYDSWMKLSPQERHRIRTALL